MRKLLTYLKDYRKESILAPLFKMLEASFELFIPLVVASIIDKGIGGSDKAYIYRMGLVMVLLGTIGLACSVTAQYFSAKAAVGFTAKVKSELYRHIQSLSYTELDQLGTSALITRMTSDMNQVQTGVNLTLRLLLRSPFVVFGAMIMAFTVNAKAAFVFVVIIPLLCVVVFGIMLFNIPMYRKVQGRLDRVLELTRENLTGARVLRAFNKQNDEIGRYRESTEELNKVQMFAGRVSGLMNPVTYVIINGGIIALIWSGAIQVDQGSISQGQLTALVNYMSHCGNRIQAVFDLKSSMEYGTLRNPHMDQTDPILTFQNVGFRYPGASEELLSDLSFTVNDGEMVGIIGGTGAGKTALVDLVARFYDATRGEIRLMGHDIRDYEEKSLRQMIGIVPQNVMLFQGTIEDNLRWRKKDAASEEIDRALEISQAKEFVQRRPKGLQTWIRQGGKNFSGGQKQRLTIARAIVGNPKILILDDSASALDFATDAKLRMALRGMKPAPTVFLVSQRASSVRYANKIIVLDDGAVAGIGTHNELLKSCPVYQEIYYSQFPKGGGDHR